MSTQKKDLTGNLTNKDARELAQALLNSSMELASKGHDLGSTASELFTVITTLTSQDDDGMVDPRVATKLESMKKKLTTKQQLTALQEQFSTLNIVKVSGRNLYRAHAGGPYTASTEEKLIEKMYFALIYEPVKPKATLNEVYQEWAMDREAHGLIKPTTTVKNHDEWKRFVLPHEICNMGIEDITPEIMDKFYISMLSTKRIVKGKEVGVKKKRFHAIHGILSRVFMYAVEKKLITQSPNEYLGAKNYNRLFDNNIQTPEVYSVEEVTAIINYIAEHPSDYGDAIAFAFNTCLRIGELIGLRRESIHNNYYRIEYTSTRDQKLSKDFNSTESKQNLDSTPKTNGEKAYRNYPITTGTRVIINSRFTKHPNDELLFAHNGKPLSTDRFNRELQKICTALDIPYRSSHQIRFTRATMYLDAGIPITQISQLLGHTSVKTTLHYFRQCNVNDETLELLESVNFLPKA